MRQAKREIKEQAEIEALLNAADVCHLALNAEPVFAAQEGTPAVSFGESQSASIATAPSAPYLVVMNFGYEFQLREAGSGLDGSSVTGLTASSTMGEKASRPEPELLLWFHSAREGRKLDLMRMNPVVGFQLECRIALLKGSDNYACEYAMDFESLVGEGVLSQVEDDDQRLHGLKLLMEHYGGGALPFTPAALERTAVLCLKVTQFTAKRSRDLWQPKS